MAGAKKRWSFVVWGRIQPKPGMIVQPDVDNARAQAKSIHVRMHEMS